jgi:hypothetical protein
MPKATIQYTTEELKELGLFVEILGRTDNARIRKMALEEIQRRMDDPEDTSLSAESFPDGLRAENLIIVEPLLMNDESEKPEEEEPEIIQAVKAIAALASLRVPLDEAHQQALKLRPLIEALFSPEPLTPEQMQQATDKNFAKILIKFAETKVTHDKFLPIAQEAWTILAPALPEVETNGNSFACESELQATPLVSQENQEASKNGNRASNS